MIGAPEGQKNSGPMGPLLKKFSRRENQAVAPPDIASGLVF